MLDIDNGLNYFNPRKMVADIQFESQQKGN